MKQIPKRFTSEELEIRRAAALEDMRAYVHGVFNDHPQMQSAVIVVGQFWCDEALDAVHNEFIFSELPEPDVAAGLANLYEGDPVNRPNGDVDFGYLENWDSNGEAISLFAAFCRSMGDQEAEPSDNYVPYAIFQRVPDLPPSFRIVGHQHRPWLDGVMPLWGDDDEVEPPEDEDLIDLFSEIYGSESA